VQRNALICDLFGLRIAGVPERQFGVLGFERPLRLVPEMVGQALRVPGRLGSPVLGR
jgi:hypothetical protein